MSFKTSPNPQKFQILPELEEHVDFRIEDEYWASENVGFGRGIFMRWR
jgi:hypothetical protein